MIFFLCIVSYLLDLVLFLSVPSLYILSLCLSASQSSSSSSSSSSVSDQLECGGETVWSLWGKCRVLHMQS